MRRTYDLFALTSYSFTRLLATNLWSRPADAPPGAQSPPSASRSSTRGLPRRRAATADNTI